MTVLISRQWEQWVRRRYVKSRSCGPRRTPKRCRELFRRRESWLSLEVTTHTTVLRTEGKNVRSCALSWRSGNLITTVKGAFNPYVCLPRRQWRRINWNFKSADCSFRNGQYLFILTDDKLNELKNGNHFSLLLKTSSRNDCCFMNSWLLTYHNYSYRSCTLYIHFEGDFIAAYGRTNWQTTDSCVEIRAVKPATDIPDYAEVTLQLAQQSVSRTSRPQLIIVTKATAHSHKSFWT